MRAALERPRPMAAVDAVKQDDQRDISGVFDAGRDEQRHVGPRVKRRALERDRYQPVTNEPRVSNLNGAKTLWHLVARASRPCLFDARARRPCYNKPITPSRS